MPSLSLMRGVLIALEGADGSGKSTLATHLAQQFTELEVPVVLTREPGQTRLGIKLRKLVQEHSVPICPKAEYLLFATDRAQHFEELVVPSLQNNKFVISDRLCDSSLVYQGFARGLDIDMIRTINTWTMQGYTPDVTVYVRVSPETAFARVRKRGGVLSSFEREKEGFARTVIEGFEQLVAPRDGVLVVDGEKESTHLAHHVAEQIIARLRISGLVI